MEERVLSLKMALSLTIYLELNGKSITKNNTDLNSGLFDSNVEETDISSGYIHMSIKSKKDELKSISDLYKIRFSKDVETN